MTSRSRQTRILLPELVHRRDVGAWVLGNLVPFRDARHHRGRRVVAEHGRQAPSQVAQGRRPPIPEQGVPLLLEDRGLQGLRLVSGLEAGRLRQRPEALREPAAELVHAGRAELARSQLILQGFVPRPQEPLHARPPLALVDLLLRVFDRSGAECRVDVDWVRWVLVHRGHVDQPADQVAQRVRSLRGGVGGCIRVPLPVFAEGGDIDPGEMETPQRRQDLGRLDLSLHRVAFVRRVEAERGSLEECRRGVGAQGIEPAPQLGQGPSHPQGLCGVIGRDGERRRCRVRHRTTRTRPAGRMPPPAGQMYERRAGPASDGGPDAVS